MTVAARRVIGEPPCAFIASARIPMIWSPSTMAPIASTARTSIGVPVERSQVSTTRDDRLLEMFRWVDLYPSLILSPSGSHPIS